MKIKSLSAIFLLALALWQCHSPSNNQTEDKKASLKLSDGNTLDYSICGNADTTLLFIHGWNINMNYWDRQLDAFCGAYTVARITLPGFGEAEAKRDEWTVWSYAKDIAEFIKAKNLKNVILIGHSMGGPIILETSVNYPENIIGLIGVDTYKDVGHQYTAQEIGEIEFFFGKLRDSFEVYSPIFASAMLFHPSTDSLVRKRVLTDYANARPEVALPVLESLIRTRAHEAELMQQLPFKLYMVNSDAEASRTEALDTLLPHSYHIEDVHATGHFPMIEKADEFNEALKRVLNLL